MGEEDPLWRWEPDNSWCNCKPGSVQPVDRHRQEPDGEEAEREGGRDGNAIDGLSQQSYKFMFVVVLLSCHHCRIITGARFDSPTALHVRPPKHLQPALWGRIVVVVVVLRG